MATEFTTWAAVVSELKDAIARRDFAKRDITKGSHRITYSSLKELREALQFAQQMADLESGAADGFTSRTVARGGARL